MINTFFFGVNLLLIYVAWNFFLKRSILDHFRDKLFDLRDDIRSFYIQNNIPLSDKTYKSLRDSLNSHLRFTEQKSLLKVAVFLAETDKYPELCKWLDYRLEESFSTDNEKLKEYILESRQKAAEILIGYMIFSSPAIMVLYIISGIFCIIKSLFNAAIRRSNLRDVVKTYILKKSLKLEGYSISHYGQNHCPT